MKLMNKLEVGNKSLEQKRGRLDFENGMFIDFSLLSDRQMDEVEACLLAGRASKELREKSALLKEIGDLRESLSITNENFDIYKRETERKMRQTRAISKNVSDNQNKKIEELSHILEGFIKETSIDGNEQDKIVKYISRRCSDLAKSSEWFNYLKKEETDSVEDVVRSAVKRCYSSIYKEFKVTSYRNLKKKDFKKAVDFISEWKPRKY